MTRDEILNFLKNHKEVLRQEFKVSRIGLFGSYATGTQTDESDIDVLVSMPSDFDLYYDLKEYLESNLHKTVDLGFEKTIRPLIRSHIQSEIFYV